MANLGCILKLIVEKCTYISFYYFGLKTFRKHILFSPISVFFVSESAAAAASGLLACDILGVLGALAIIVLEVQFMSSIEK